MKDIIIQVPKAQSVINLLFIILFYIPFFSQNNSNESISDKEYEVINSIFTDRNNDNIKPYIYYKTYYDKGWGHYFSDENLKSITDNVAFPTEISDEELKTYFTHPVIEKIYDNIYLSKPLTLDSNKISNKNIKLVRSFDKLADLKKGVMRISKPIIIGDIAIIRIIGFNAAPIHILKMENREWKIKYTFCDWLIIE